MIDHPTGERSRRHDARDAGANETALSSVSLLGRWGVSEISGNADDMLPPYHDDKRELRG